MTIDTARLATDAGYWLDSDPSDGEATHFEPVYSDHECAWVRVDRKGLRHYFYDGGWVCADKTKDDIGPVDSMIPRPQPQPEWVDGLPPVGSQCELNLYGYWVVATVLAYGKTKFLYEIAPGQVDNDGDLIGGELEGGISKAKFRPIPTKAQRDRDELALSLKNAIESVTGDAFDDTDALVVANDLLAKGWTKQ